MIATVLVIEDNQMNADVLRENLIDAGYKFTLAVNGAAGVAVANEMLPDIILMDVNLPILDGLSATRLLKKNTTTQGIPILALTARAMTGDRESCLAAGCDDYVSKPIDVGVLLAKIRHHLDRRPPAFVEMIARQRSEAEAREPDDTYHLKAGMAPRDYEEEFAVLNRHVEDLEGRVRTADLRVAELDEALSHREQQIAKVIGERDAVQREFDKCVARMTDLTSERDRVKAHRDALKLEIDGLRESHAGLEHRVATMAAQPKPAPAPVVVAAPQAEVEPEDRSARELAARRKARKLGTQLEAAQEQIADLQRQIDSLPKDIRSLQAQHETLRSAFLTLHGQVKQAAEDALHQVAFGGT